VVAVAAPVRLTVAPDPPAPEMVPEMVYTATEEKFSVAFAEVRVTAWLAGVNP
jgi:hypothetical protein